MSYKVVYGSCASGFRDVTGPMSHAECVKYLEEHEDQLSDPDEDSHYAEGLDIVDADGGRLASYVLFKEER